MYGSTYPERHRCKPQVVLYRDLLWLHDRVVCGGSFRILPPEDGGVESFGIILHEVMGAFAGIFVATLTFIVMRRADFSDSTSEDASTALRDFFSCESVRVWEKTVAVLLRLHSYSTAP